MISHRVFLALGLVGVVAPVSLPAQAKRPMTFFDVQQMKQAGSVALSPDGRSALYTLSVPDWKEAKRFIDIWMVSAAQGCRNHSP